MKTSKIANVLELALIELEYAVADFLHQRSTGNHEAQRRDLEVLLSKLLGANRTVQNAVAALDRVPDVAAMTAQPERARPGPFAA